MAFKSKSKSKSSKSGLKSRLKSGLKSKSGLEYYKSGHWLQNFTHYYRQVARSLSMPVLFLLSGPKMVFFALQGWHIAPINVKFGTGEGTAGLLPRAKFHIYRGKFLLWSLSGTNNQVMSIFPKWGHFPTNFQ